MAVEQVAIVDEYDNEIGIVTRADSVTQKLRARVAFIYVVDPATKKIAITQRGADLSYQPLAWQPSAGGYVMHGEAWDDAAARELKEELGIASALLQLETFSFNDPEGDRPFLFGFYACAGDSTQLKADPREIMDIKFMTLDEAEHLGSTADDKQLHSAYRVGIKCLRENWERVVAFI